MMTIPKDNSRLKNARRSRREIFVIQKGCKPSQSPAVAAPPKGEPRGSTPLHNMSTYETEHIGTDMLC